MGVRPFVVDVPASAIADLHARLDNARWPPAVNDDWSDGTSPSALRELVHAWRHEFDWRDAERRLNELPQVQVDIDGEVIHAVHRPGIGPAPLPLVLTHGWPSTFIEWRHVIGPLADPAAYGGDPADAFHVVAPSLPGYGFSSIPQAPGTSPRRIAQLWLELMDALGYHRFAAHGCDWGASITGLLGLTAADRLVGIHMGMLGLGPERGGPRVDSEEDRAYSARLLRWRDVESAYVSIQATKPQTLAYGLADSPVGTAAWIYEKWRAWADCEGELVKAIDLDDLLTNISIYWFTGTLPSANRLYREGRLDSVRVPAGQRVEVPAGFLLESADEEGDGRSFLDAPRLGPPPRLRAERVFDVRRWTIAERGGHFPALEIPDLFVEEIRAFFRPLRG